QVVASPTATTAVPTTVVRVVSSPTVTTAVPTLAALPLATVPLPTSTRAPAPAATPTLNPLLFATAVPASERITMKNTLFQPASLQVKSGTLVVWENAETTNTPHFIVSGSCDNNICTPTNQFASDILSPGQSFSLRFTYVGTYSYYCVLHGAKMTGVITVIP
ncbi:MAG TPA: plastocyanin/azurin family copper-binding protein, partial [Anaerolineae bacterium]